MFAQMEGPAIALANDAYQTSYAKTSHGLVRGSERFQLVGVVDPLSQGLDAGTLLDGQCRNIPISSSVKEAVLKAALQPKFCIVGVATHGGVLPESLKISIREAIELGLHVINGLHHSLNDEKDFVTLAQTKGVDLIDIRKPPSIADLHFWSSAILKSKTPKIAVLGTDCALGKRTTTRFLLEATRKRGLRSEMLFTGQTGWLQSKGYGFILDCTPNDFVCGELEHALLQCEKNLNPEVIFIEGQSALRNPAGPCGSEMILSANAKGIILQHAPHRTFFDGLEAEQIKIPSPLEEKKLIEALGGKLLGLCLNGEGLSTEEMKSFQKAYAAQLDVPVVIPLLEGVAGLLPVIQSYCESARQ